jgi:hypothetical protein
MSQICIVFSKSPKNLPRDEITTEEKAAWLGQTMTLSGQVWKVVEVQKWRDALYIQITPVAPALDAVRLN